MKKSWLLLLVYALPTIAISGGQSANLDAPGLVRFLKNAQTCEHLASEWDPDMAKREKRVIERNINTYCGLAQKQRGLLLKKYGRDDAVLQALNQYESVTNYAPGK
jgi:hypothetical protein